MQIHEATAAALEGRCCMTRLKWHYAGFYCRVMPTNTPDLCILLSRAARHASRGWQPTAEDLLADDWLLIGRYTDAGSTAKEGNP